MTPFDTKVATMRRIVDAAGGRSLTHSQKDDFDTASKEALGLVIDAAPDAVHELLGTVKSAGNLGDIVDGFEGWSARHAGGRKSAGRAVIEPNGPIGSGFDSAPSAGWQPSYSKPLNWGAEFEQAHARAAKALLEVGSTAVSTPLAVEPIADPRQAQFIYQLLPGSDAEGGNFGYLRQTARTNNAAEVATGALKPVSIFTLERVNDTVKVFAHVTEPVDRYLLEDAPNLRQFLDQELRYGLAKAFDAHVVNEISTVASGGGGGGVTLLGIRVAITTLQEADLEPDAIVLTPGDWQNMEAEATVQFTQTDNRSSITDAMAHRLYGVPVVVSNSIDPDTAIVGDFRGSGRIFRTGNASITIHDSQPRVVGGADYADYRLNQLVLRAEMRAEIAVWRPSGFILVGGPS